MAIFGKCCCCHLKSGNIVLASLFLVGALITLVFSASRINDLHTFRNGPWDDLLPQLSDSATLVHEGMNIVMNVLIIPASICLIAGAIKANRQLIAVFLVVDGICIVLSILTAFMVMIIDHTESNLAILIVSYIIAVGFSILIWLFPLSLYQEVRDSLASGTAHKDNGQVHYPAANGQVLYPALSSQPPPYTKF